MEMEIVFVVKLMLENRLVDESNVPLHPARPWRDRSSAIIARVAVAWATQSGTTWGGPGNINTSLTHFSAITICWANDDSSSRVSPMRRRTSTSPSAGMGYSDVDRMNLSAMMSSWKRARVLRMK
jgi:hypothetical protein